MKKKATAKKSAKKEVKKRKSGPRVSDAKVTMLKTLDRYAKKGNLTVSVGGKVQLAKQVVLTKGVLSIAL